MKFKFLLIGLLVMLFSVESYAKDDISKITFDKNLESKIISDEVVDIRVGTRSIGEEITFNREVSLENIVGGGGGFDIYFAEIQAEATRVYGYSFGQSRARTNSITIDSKECKKVRVVVKYLMRKGKVIKVNGEEFKFEIIDNAKVDAYPLDCSNSTSSTQTTNNSKWITPSNSVCKSNGGKVTSWGCEATWSNAKKICSSSGDSLPSIDVLRKVVTDCGGEMKDDTLSEWARNENNSNYQSCYKEKGFSKSEYWSKTSKGLSSAWSVYFKNGNDFWYDKGCNLKNTKTQINTYLRKIA